VTTNAPILTEHDQPIDVPKHQTFPTLDAAHAWANSLIGQGIKIQASRIWEDRISKPRSHIIKLLGVEKKAAAICARLAPGGQWNVEVETPGTPYQSAGILDRIDRQTKFHRCMAWYDRFLPYAYGMMLAEWDYHCLGIDFESINSYCGTCMGFVGLGQGDGAESDTDPYWRIVKEDVALFSDVYQASMSVKSPSLPFDEAFGPCCAFVSLKAPRELSRHFKQDCWIFQHVRDVADNLSLPQPDFHGKSQESTPRRAQ